MISQFIFILLFKNPFLIPIKKEYPINLDINKSSEIKLMWHGFCIIIKTVTKKTKYNQM